MKRRLMKRRLVSLGAVLLALAGLYVAAWQTLPKAGSAASATAPAGPAGATGPAGTTTAVTSVTRTCPPPGPNTGVSRIAMVAVPRQGAGTVSAGSAQLSAIPSSPSTATSAPGQKASPKTGSTATVTTPGALALQTAPQPTQYGGTAVSATGAMAQGFEAEEATAAGLGTVTCTHPSSDMWFVGTGVQTGAPVTKLYLMNTGAVTASVEYTMLTDAGIQQGQSAAVTIGPGQYLSEDVAADTRTSVVIAVHVQTSTGQVAAAVWQGPARGSGGTWLPQAAEPATRVVVPGLTTASSAARLFVVVPGAADARFRVQALTAHGQFLPFGAAPQDAPAAASSAFALTSLGASAASLVLTSNVPITAGVAVPGSSAIGSFSAAAAPVTEQGVVAGNPGGNQGSVGLVLSAPGSAAIATVTVVPSATSTGQPAQSSRPAPQVVKVPANRTVQVAVPRPAGSQPFAIVLTPRPGSGALYAARVVTSGSGLTGPVLSILPVPSAVTEVTLPLTRDSYTAVVP